MEETREHAAVTDAMTDTTMDQAPRTTEPDNGDAASKRLRGFAIHLVVFFVIAIAIGGVNFFYAPGEWWFVFPMVLWGAPLALHAAYAMGLFKAFR